MINRQSYFYLNIVYNKNNMDRQFYNNDKSDIHRSDRLNQLNYQKGYADGYRRLLNMTTQKVEEYQYMYNVLLVLFLFLIFILITVYMYYPKIIRWDSNYEGDCLLDLSSTYHTEGCFDR